MLKIQRNGTVRRQQLHPSGHLSLLCTRVRHLTAGWKLARTTIPHCSSARKVPEIPFTASQRRGTDDKGEPCHGLSAEALEGRRAENTTCTLGRAGRTATRPHHLARPQRKAPSADITHWLNTVLHYLYLFLNSLVWLNLPQDSIHWLANGECPSLQAGGAVRSCSPAFRNSCEQQGFRLNMNGLLISLGAQWLVGVRFHNKIHLALKCTPAPILSPLILETLRVEISLLGVHGSY